MESEKRAVEKHRSKKLASRPFYTRSKDATAGSYFQTHTHTMPREFRKWMEVDDMVPRCPADVQLENDP